MIRQGAAEEIRKQIEANTMRSEKTPTSVDLPLSNESKRVLAYAAEEAELLRHRHLGTEHILLGLLREEKSFGAQLLMEHGLRLSTMRELLSAGETTLVPETFEPGETGEGIVEFVGADSVRIAVTGISRATPVPRVGEIVLLELRHGQQRFRVSQVQYDYRVDPRGSPHAANALFRIRVYVMAAPLANDREMWSHST